MSEDSLTPTQVHGRLDAAGLLDDAQRPGTYALQVKTPDDVETLARQWRTHVDAALADESTEQLTADCVCYVGASQHVYDRLQDHAAGDVRQATFLSVFPPVDVVGVWPSDTPFRDEVNRAVALSDDWTVWCDGEVF